MPIYKIVDLIVSMNPTGKTLIDQSKDYLTNQYPKIDISLEFPKGFLMQLQRENPKLTEDECEYIGTGALFYQGILDYNGFMLHSSGVVYENKAYLFSGSSGIGKSTHASLWQSYFGKDEVFIINDDKPAIRLKEDKFIVYGTPFSGKTALNKNLSIPLQGICFMEQARESWIREIDSKEAIYLMLSQTLRPRDSEHMEILIELLDRLLRDIPVYRMGSTISFEIVKLAYETMK